MAVYTTGEVAKLCGVTVRTVQYYDSRNILNPSQLSEGGRRLYSEEDLNRMKIICFLRSLDLSINDIAKLLSEAQPEDVIGLLLQQQEQQLRSAVQQNQEKLDKITGLRKTLKTAKDFSLESIGDAAVTLGGRKKLHRMRRTILFVGLGADAVQLATVLLWIFTGIWWPFAFVWIPLALATGIWISRYYFRNTAYICPRCHKVFRPALRESFWAWHTPTTRKLTCKHCAHRGFCVEIYNQE